MASRLLYCLPSRFALVTARDPGEGEIATHESMGRTRSDPTDLANRGASDDPRATRIAHPDRLLVGLGVVVGLLTLATAAQIAIPAVPLLVVAPELDYIVNTASMLIPAAVGLLAWVRSRETTEPDAVFQASAFAVLSMGGAIGIVLLVSDSAYETGFDRTAPGQAPLYIWTLQRLFAAAILLAGAAAALRRWGTPGPKVAVAVVIGPAAALMALTALVLVNRNGLPALVPAEDLLRLTSQTGAVDFRAMAPPLVVLQLTVAALFATAVVAYYRVYHNEGGRRRYVGFLASALVLAAFSQVHFAIVPGAYADLLTTGDVLRLFFYVVLGLGVVAGWRQDLRELRAANVDLRRLHGLELERAALEERARLAREIHDGLVQELWLARLTHGRLMASLQDVAAADEVAETARRVDSILDSALAEARQAVVALQPDVDLGFGAVLDRFVEDYADRFGLVVECTIPPAVPEVEPRQQGEILRICREALNNARKHADPTLVRVALETLPGELRLTVADDGPGFDPSIRRAGYGLRGMAERAATIGAALHVDGAPERGTTVTLRLPRQDP